ncbi:histidine kinase dimerization/phosphoacceptor domain -containing protein [Phenylobacterium sp.]|uniref:sensor histidine kinase n=1 Tax=Phenylobacterium sp. TaxID=1871053 RepID=UPI0025E8CEAE|nr:histidine kinase dimerization/phosphoacceptor domain -containing protein [Phenylobacterium sp.]
MDAATLIFVDEISHRVVNEYAAAISQLSVAAAGTGDAASRDVLSLAAQQLRRCATAHRALQRPFIDEEIDLADHLACLCRALCEATLCERGIHLELSTQTCWLSADRCWRVGLICAELITNAVRHGLGGRPGVISVLMSCADGRVQCWIVSDGRSARRGKPGRGSQVVRGLAQQLGGRIEWCDAPQGVAAMLSFPCTADD